MFRDRREAGKLLAEKLSHYAGRSAVVYALPRGGVVLGAEIARALKAPLDLIVVRKIGHPSSSEYAIGVVDAEGNTLLNEREAATLDPSWLSDETERQRKEALRRIQVYLSGRSSQDVAGKTAIIVDDGIATGFSMQLAVKALKKKRPAKIVVAVPVAPPDSLARLTELGADEIVLLESPQDFLGAVGMHYAVFEQLSDAEVMKYMRDSA